MVSALSQLRIVAIWYALLGTFCSVSALVLLYAYGSDPSLWETSAPLRICIGAAIAFWVSAGLSFRYLVLSRAGQMAALVISILLALCCIVPAGWVTLMSQIGPGLVVWWALATAFSVCSLVLWRHRRASNNRWTGREIWLDFIVPVVAVVISLAGPAIATRMYESRIDLRHGWPVVEFAEAFDRAAGLKPLSATTGPELRVWQASQGSIFGYAISSQRALRCKFVYRNDGITASVGEARCVPSNMPVEERRSALEFLPELSSLNGKSWGCAFGGETSFAEGFVSGQRFAFQVSNPEFCKDPDSLLAARLVAQLQHRRWRGP